MDVITNFFVSNKPQCIFFLLFMAACVPMLYYYSRKNPNPRFRPTMGEMTMVTLFCMFASGGLAVGLGSVFNDRQDLKKLTQKPGKLDGMSTDSSIEATDEKTTKKKDAATQFIDSMKGKK